MTTPPYQSGPYGQPNQDPYGQGGGYGQYGQYGQPQPPQQQYGQQPQYDQPTQQINPQWPNYGGLGGGPPQPPQKNKTPMIVAIVTIAVLVIAGAGVGIYFATKGDDTTTASGDTTTNKPDDTSTSEDETTSDEETTEETTDEPATSGEAYDAQPGDCIKVNVASADNADVEIADCSDDAAAYVVGTREEVDTADCPNDQYVTYTEEGRLLLCLQLNVDKGDCIQVADDVDSKVDCSDPNVTNTVLDTFDVDDETQCPQEGLEQAVTYPQPPLTICLGGPTG